MRFNLLFIFALLFSSILSEAQIIDFSTINNENEGCAGELFVIYFTNQSTINGDDASYQWYFGDGDSSELENPSHPYKIPGLFTVQLIVTEKATGLKDTVEKEDFILAGKEPIANFILLSTEEGCLPHSASFRDTTTVGDIGLSSYLWDFGNGQIDSVQHPTIIYTQSVNAKVVLKVTDSLGCKSEIDHRYSFDLTKTRPLVTNLYDQPLGCSTPHCVAFDDASTGNGPLTYLWEFGVDSSSISTEKNPSYCYADTGFYTVKKRVTDSLNCSSLLSESKVIKIRYLHAEYTADTFSLCESMKYNFSDSSSSYAESWTYYYGNGDSSLNKDNTYEYSDTLLYQSILKVEDDFNCIAYDTIDIDVQLNVAAKFDTSKIITCQDSLTIQFFDSSKNASTWLWNFGDDETSTDKNPIHFYASQGVYNVSLTVTDTNDCSHTMTVTNKIILENYNSKIQIDTFPYCTPALLFVDQTPTVPNEWEWSFMDTIKVKTQNTTYTFRDSGTYKIQLKVTGDYCSDSSDTNLYIATVPSLYANFISDSTFSCDTNFEVHFRDTSKNARTWLWDFGNGEISFEQHPTVTFRDSGTYNVSLTITDIDGCTDVLTKNKYIEARMPFIYQDPIYQCETPLTIDFIDINEKSNQTIWDFGDGNNATIKDTSYTYPSGAIYNIAVTISDTNTTCSMLFRDAIAVGGLNLSLNVDSLTCYGEEIDFQASADNVIQWNWEFGDGSIDTVQNPTHLYESTGIYDIKVIAYNERCTDTIHKLTYLMVQDPVSYFTKTLNCDNPLNVSFTDSSSGAVSYLWDFGDGDQLLNNNPIHNYQSNGDYIVSLTTFNDDCSNTYKDTLSIQVMEIGFQFDTIQCWGDSVVFNDQSFAVQEWNWNFGDNENSSLSSPSHFYTDPGNYEVTLITTANTICKDTISDSIEILSPKPQYYIKRDCNNPYTITFIDSSIDATAIVWDFGDSTETETDSFVVHQFADTGKYNITLTATNNLTSCTSIIYDTIYITDIEANFSINNSVVCFDIPVEFIDKSDFSKEWLWVFDSLGVETSTDKDPTFTFDDLGFFDVKLVVKDTFSCKDSIIINNAVQVLGPKTYFDDLHDCIDYYTVQYSDSSIDAESYIWDFGNGVSSTLQSPTYTYNSFDTYLVKLTTINNTNNCSHSFSKEVNIFAPLASFTSSSTNTCALTAVNFVNTSIFSISSLWNFGDISISKDDAPIKRYSNAGLYDVKLVYTDINGCKDSLLAEDYIKVNTNPTAQFGYDTNSVCAPYDIQFSDLSISDTNIISYTWTFGDGKSSRDENPLHHYKGYSSIMNYDISLAIVNANNCYDDILVKENIKVTFPKAKFNGSQTFCVGENIELSNLSEGFGLNYNWYFSDGDYSDQLLPNKSFDSIGVYEVLYVLTDTFNCIDTFIREENSIYISKPVAQFYTNDSTSKYCPTLLVNFLDASQDLIISYTWDFGDSSGVGLGEEVSHLYNEVGIFDVKLVVETAGGCKDSIIKEDFISITGPDATLSVVEDPPYGCKPLTVHFELSDLTGVDNYFFNYADGDTFDIKTVHTYKTIGSFVPQVWVTQYLNDDEFCTYLIESSDTIETAKVKASFIMNGENEGCPPLSTSFTDNSDFAVSWEWIFGDGTIDTGLTVNHNFEKSGDYDVSLVVTDIEGCNDTLLVENAIDVYDIISQFSIDTNKGCSPFTIDFTNLSSSEGKILDWNWNFGDGNTAINPLNKTNIYSNTEFATYYPSLTIIDDNECTMTFIDTVSLYLYPKVNFESDTDSICPRISLQLTNLTPDLGEDRYQWYFEETDSVDSNRNTTYAYLNSGYHSVQLRAISEFGCDTTLVKNNYIYVHQYPSLSVTKGVEIGQGQSTTLKANGVDFYSWEPSELIDDPTLAHAIATPVDTTIFYVTGTDSNNCELIDSVTIIVKKSIQSAILFPDAFSPNGDGVNDELKFVNFQITTLQYFTIYNQWGQVVFETDNIDKGWDGTYKQQSQPIGNYAFIVGGLDKNGKQINVKGTFSLIR